MAPGREDDALTWEGDDDPTLDARTAGPVAAGPAPADGDQAGPDARESAEAAVLPEGYTAVGKGSETFVAGGAADAARTGDRNAEPRGLGDATGRGAADAATPAMGNAELISLGVLGGFAVLFAVGWLIGGLRLQGTAEFLVAPLAYQVSLWLAVLAPLVWFATALVLTRGRRLWVRFAWLIGGVVLLVPWPFIMVGAIGR